MAYTASDLVAIDAAIAQSETRVKFADREVNFRSIDELLKARKYIATQIEIAASGAPIRSTYATFNKD